MPIINLINAGNTIDSNSNNNIDTAIPPLAVVSSNNNNNKNKNKSNNNSNNNNNNNNTDNTNRVKASALALEQNRVNVFAARSRAGFQVL